MSSCAAIALSCAPTLAEDEIPISVVVPYYVSLFGGIGSTSNSNVSISPLSVGFTEDGDRIEFGTGYLVGGAVGFVLTPGWRAELELAYRRNTVSAYYEGTNTFPVPNGAKSGDAISAFSIMANAFHDIEVAENISVHVGAGIGIARLHLDMTNIDHQFTSGFAPIDDSYWALAGQLGAGIDWKVGNGWILFVDYRAFMARDATFTGINFSSGRQFNFDMDYFNQAVMVGFKLPIGG